jgi:deoxyribodipyrimidine photo-lyase
MKTIIIWLDNDFRLEDHPALSYARDKTKSIVPLYILPEKGAWSPGQASLAWLQKSLQAFDQSLQEKGLRLILREGPVIETLQKIIEETGADEIVWNRHYTPEEKVVKKNI